MADWKDLITDNDWRDLRTYVAGLETACESELAFYNWMMMAEAEEITATITERRQALHEQIKAALVHPFRVAIILAPDAEPIHRETWLNPAEYTPEQLS